MAEICCEAAAAELADRKGECVVADAGSRAARRRRMEIRRLRIVAEEQAAKRRRLEEGDDEDAVMRAPAPRFGVTSVCGRRRDMEDAVTTRPDFIHGHHFFGVFDGHGCSHVATSCGVRMHEIVAEEATAAAAGSSVSDEAARWRDVMEKSYARMNAEAVGSRDTAAGAAPTCRCEMQLPKCDHVGSTAVVAVVGPRHLVVANCGDSRAVLCSGGAAIPLSADHKATTRGGDRSSPTSNLSPRQSSGDDEEATAGHSDDGAASDSDGEGSGEDSACADAAILLTKLALARQTADNVSVVIVNLRRRPRS
nr:unnamed protein product [Digitaria exilis]